MAGLSAAAALPGQAAEVNVHGPKAAVSNAGTVSAMLQAPSTRGWRWAEHFSKPDSLQQVTQHQEALGSAWQLGSQAGRQEDDERLSSLTVQSTAVVDENWQKFNDSQLTPLLPMEIVWLLEDAQDRLRNRSNLPLQLDMARTLARYTSIVYCQGQNIMAWNCSR